MNMVINLIRQQNYPILSSLSCSQNPVTVPHPQFIVVFTKSCHCTPSSVHCRVHKILSLYPILSSLSYSQTPATVPHPQFIVVFTKSCHCTPSSVHCCVHKILSLYPILSSLSCSQNPATVPHPQLIVVFTKSWHCTPSSVHCRFHKILPLYPILSSLPCSHNPATEPILSQYTSLHNLTPIYLTLIVTLPTPSRVCLQSAVSLSGFSSNKTQLLTTLNNCNRPERKKKSTVFRRLQAYTVS